MSVPAPIVPLDPPDKPWFDPKTGIPTPSFARYMQALDRAIRALCALT